MDPVGRPAAPEIQQIDSAPTSSTIPIPPTVVVPQVTTIADPARPPIVLGFAGDTSFTNGLAERDPFGDFLELLQNPDFFMVNLETTVAHPSVGRAPVPKKFLFRSPPESLDLLVAAGVDAVGLANNHTLDFGPEALEQTLAELDARSLAHAGAGVDASSAYEPLIVDVGEWTIGLVSLSRVPCDWSASGEENEVCPSPFMLELEQRMAELGVDVVINGHPHVLQGVTSWPRSGGGQMIAAHSSGNFAFPSARGVNTNSAVFLVSVAEEGVSLRLEPVRVNGGVLSVPSDDQRSAILEQVNSVSHGWEVDDFGVMIEVPGKVADC